jgi:hypothetical protein
VDSKTFSENSAAFLGEMQGILVKKGADYSVGDDRLSNFRMIAETTGLTMRQVWAVYVNKHLFAVMKWVREGQVESEPIHGRFVDVANYMALADAIAREEAKGAAFESEMNKYVRRGES